MKILFHSNGPFCPTGYGQQTGLFARLLIEAGHEVAVSAFYGVQGGVLTWGPQQMKLYPCGYQEYGKDVILDHAKHHFGGDLRDGLVVTLIDVWVFNGADFTRANVASWTPVDHDPVTPGVRAYFEASAAFPIAMSRHGESRLRDCGLDPFYVPHGIDTETFCPRDKVEARKRVGLPESAFIVGMVAANKGQPSRKGFPQAVEAFARFRERHEDAILYMHTEPHGRVNGMALPPLFAAHGLPEGSVRIPDPYLGMIGFSPDTMADVFSSFDVLLNPAYGEGFGIPIVESQSCGVPVIVTDWTSMSELAGPGWRVDGDRWWSQYQSFWKLPSVDGIVAALEDAYVRAGALKDECREFAVGYDARRVLEEYWLPTLSRIEQVISERAVLPEVVEMPELVEAA